MRPTRPTRRPPAAALVLGAAAGVAALAAVASGLVAAQAMAARQAIGDPLGRWPSSGRYGDGRGPELRLLVLGDSSAVGLGAATREQTPGALLAGGVAEVSGRPVRLLNVARVGARSSGLDAQVDAALERMPAPELAVAFIGVNDVTHGVRRAVATAALGAAVRRLRATGAEVVVGTCADLGTIKPFAQPLRTLVRLLSRRLATAQTVAVVGAGGRTVSLGDLLGPAFAAAPHEMFAVDRFHPSAVGYARVVDVVLPSACAALGLACGPEDAAGAGAGRLSPVAEAAAAAANAPGTEVTGASVGGADSGPRGRWTRALRRPRAVLQQVRVTTRP